MAIHSRANGGVWCGIADRTVELVNYGHQTMCGGCGGILIVEERSAELVPSWS